MAVKVNIHQSTVTLLIDTLDTRYLRVGSGEKTAGQRYCLLATRFMLKFIDGGATHFTANAHGFANRWYKDNIAG